MYRALSPVHFSKQPKKKHALLYCGSNVLLLKYMDDKRDFASPGVLYL